MPKSILTEYDKETQEWEVVDDPRSWDEFAEDLQGATRNEAADDPFEDEDGEGSDEVTNDDWDPEDDPDDAFDYDDEDDDWDDDDEDWDEDDEFEDPAPMD